MTPTNYWIACICKTFIIGTIISFVLLGFIIFIDLTVFQWSWPGYLPEYVTFITVAISYTLALKGVKHAFRRNHDEVQHPTRRDADK